MLGLVSPKILNCVLLLLESVIYGVVGCVAFNASVVSLQFKSPREIVQLMVLVEERLVVDAVAVNNVVTVCAVVGVPEIVEPLNVKPDGNAFAVY